MSQTIDPTGLTDADALVDLEALDAARTRLAAPLFAPRRNSRAQSLVDQQRQQGQAASDTGARRG